MNSIIFADSVLFNLAVTALEMDATPMYELDSDTLTINSYDIDAVMDILHDNGIHNFNVKREDDDVREDNFRNDVEADADVLASAGYGTDEDYEHNLIDDEPKGCLGDEE